MKRVNLIFLGECIIIVCLLVLIGLLMKPEISSRAKEEAILLEEGSSEELVNSEIKEEVVTEETNTPIVEVLEESQENAITVSDNEINHQEIESASLLTTKEVIERNKKTQIVVFGDSIWNAGRGEDGISELVMKEKDVIIYNCSIGGTTAAVFGESTDWEDWTSNSFNGMMYLVNDILSEDQLIPNDAAAAVLKQIDFNEVDYIIVSYGLNDYFSDVPIFPKEYFDLTSYIGALRHGIHKIQKQYPDIKFILTSPTYCGWFEGERQFGLGDYVEAARSVSQEYGTYFLDMYHALGKNPQEKTEYLEDGVHLTVEGRELYARSVIDFLNQIEYNE